MNWEARTRRRVTLLAAPVAIATGALALGCGIGLPNSSAPVAPAAASVDLRVHLVKKSDVSDWIQTQYFIISAVSRN